MRRIKIAAYAAELRNLGYTGTAKIQSERFASLPKEMQIALATIDFENGETYFFKETNSYFLERGGDICEQNMSLFGDDLFYPITHHNFDYDVLKEMRKKTIVAYTQSSHNTSSTIVVEVKIESYKIPSKSSAERNGREIYFFLQEEFKEVTFPTTAPTRTEERGGDWTSHYIQYWD
jgi:hypothetical protein